MKKYHGITYLLPLKLLPLWKLILCRRNVHVFDEVVSSWNEGEHYLVCDACELIVNIESIEEDGE
jgi:hypothetical protein